MSNLDFYDKEYKVPYVPKTKLEKIFDTIEGMVSGAWGLIKAFLWLGLFIGIIAGFIAIILAIL